MRVAIAHDYLTQRGGAERAVLSLSDAFPTAPIHTSLYLPDGTFGEFRQRDVRPGPLDRIGPLRRNHRAALPLYPLSFAAQRIDADVTICSSSGWAHGARVTGAKVVYCYAPARWLYQSDVYLDGFPPFVGRGLRALRRPLTWWDQRAAASATRYVTISARSQEMIGDAYGIDAEVLPPPHTLDPNAPLQPLPGIEPGYHLSVSRLLSYKNVPQLVEAYRGMPKTRLVIVGEGPLDQELRRDLPANVVLAGRVSDAELRWLYANAAVLVAVSYEDLGLTPVEAALFGTPALTLRFGGYLDTIVEGINGSFIDEPTPAAIRRAVESFDPGDFDSAEVRSSADRYDRTRFEARLHSVVDEVLR